MAAMLRAGAATGIGSLPHTDPVAAARFVLDLTPDLPAVPELPRRRPAEGMIPRVGRDLDGVEVAADGSLVVADPRRVGPPLGPIGFEPDAHGGMLEFGRVLPDDTRVLKTQICGPVTLAAALVHLGVTPNRALSSATGVVTDHVRAHLAFFPDRTVVVTLDEPLLGALGRGELPFDRARAADAVSSCLAGVERDSITAIHCCGRADATVLIEVGTAMVFAPMALFVAQTAAWAGFLDRGGWIGWGVVATDGPVGEGTAHHWKGLTGSWCELVKAGVDPARLRTQAVVTPDCGLASHGDSQAERSLRLTAEVADRLRADALAMRFAHGA